MVKQATVLEVLSAFSFIAGVAVLSVGVVCLRMNNSWGILCGNLLAVIAGALMVVAAITALKTLRKGLETLDEAKHQQKQRQG